MTGSDHRGESKKNKLPKGQTVLAEVALMFLPSLPAYLWLWPAVSDTRWEMPVQVLVYVYFFAATLFIGLRHWTLVQLGVSRQGWLAGIFYGAVLLVARLLVVGSLSKEWSFPPFDLGRVLGEMLFYFLAVGLVEELLFRGLIYTALHEWRGVRWAIWGSSIAFGLYHIGGQGVLGGLGTFLLGVIFATMRWRLGGLLGLMFTHGLIDIVSVETMPVLNPQDMVTPDIVHPWMLVAGYFLLFGLPIFLWKAYPWLEKIRVKRVPPSV